MLISRNQALVCGIGAIVGVIVIQAFNSFACYGHDLWSFLVTLGVFLAVPLLPAVFSLMTANPLRAIGACVLFAPWLLFAYYTDCVTPYAGGGASMIYVAVVLWGTPSAVLGAVITGPIMRALRVSISGQ
jgi:hypothetical protein